MITDWVSYKEILRDFLYKKTNGFLCTPLLATNQFVISKMREVTYSPYTPDLCPK